MKKLLLLLFVGALISLNAAAQGLTYNVTVPAGTNACYIAGDMNGWAHMEMDKVDDTHYTLTIAGSHAGQGYKYCSGPDWAYVEKNAAGNDIGNRVYSASDVVERWLAVYVPAAVPQDYVYNVEVPIGTNLCYIAGSFNSWSHQKMNKVDATNFTITINTITPNGYKFTSGPGWDYVEQQADCTSDVADRVYALNNVVACWKSVFVPTPIIIKARTPWVDTYLHIWDGSRNVTSWPGVLMTQAGDISVYQVIDEPNISFLFHNNSGAQTANISNVTASSCYKVETDNSFAQEDCATYVITGVNETEKPSLFVSGMESRIEIQLNGDANMVVYNMQGALIRQAQFTDTYTIDNLKSGLYLLKINGETYKAVVK